MLIVDQFFYMEKKYSLFEIKENEKFPLWDILRSDIYRLLVYKSYVKSLENIDINKKKYIFNHIYNIISFLFHIPFFRKKYLIFPASRYMNSKGVYFDKSAISVIKLLSNKALVFEATFKLLDYPYNYNYCFFFRRILKANNLNQKDYCIIKTALEDCFPENKIPYDYLNDAYMRFQKDFKFYSLLFKILKPQKVICSIGDFRALFFACKLQKIESILIQHSGIERDTIEFSYPSFVTLKSNIIFCDKLFTFGSYWGKNMNLPTDVVPLGNDYFNNIPIDASDNSVLIISTIIHGNELKILTKEMALIRKDLIFNYKLHPNEYHNKQLYVDYFKNIENVIVLSLEYDTSILISRSQLVVLIVSGVLYEALNQNKKVAIYKKIDYDRSIIYQKIPNLFIVDNAIEVLSVINAENKKSNESYYSSIDFDLMKQKVYSRK